MTGVWVLLGALVVAGIAGWWLRAGNGRIRTGHGASAADSTRTPTAEARTPAADLPEPIRAALDPAAAVTLVQLSTTFCASCRQADKLLSGVAEDTDGLTHVELDVTEDPSVATKVGVMRTPTTLALTADGTELLRVGGVPKREALLDALREHLPTPVTSEHP
ncbi:MAG TPA: thioredoxin family protein [Pseudonocardiaceae bacterium]|jgi:thiol-disulfide isomerase/thioredoxin|nr:thioredoxin family protein [Pseudonocardiaceae bacterium]